MRVEILKNVFEHHSAGHLRAINYLLQIILYKGRYVLSIDDDDVKKTNVFSNLHQTDQDAINQSIIASVLGSYTPDCVVQMDGDTYQEEKKFNVEEAIKYLTQPVSIVVENSLNDAYFLRALFRCFDISNRLNEMCDNQWLKFENAGGCSNIINFLNGKLDSYQKKSKFFRCFVLVDSDLTYPAEDFKHNHLKDYFIKYSISYHFLEKRMVENYVPDDAFEKWKTKELGLWINAFLHLSEEQKDYFNIPVGFFKEKDGDIQIFDSLNVNVQSLYHDLSDGNFNHLKNGFKLPNFKTEFPKIFEDSSVIYKKSLEKKTSHQQNKDELQEVVNKIKNLI